MLPTPAISRVSDIPLFGEWLERFRIRLTISDMPDEGGAFVWGELIEKGADLGPEGVDGAFRRFSKQGFQL